MDTFDESKGCTAFAGTRKLAAQFFFQQKKDVKCAENDKLCRYIFINETWLVEVHLTRGNNERKTAFRVKHIPLQGRIVTLQLGQFKKIPNNKSLKHTSIKPHKVEQRGHNQPMWRIQLQFTLL